MVEGEGHAGRSYLKGVHCPSEVRQWTRCPKRLRAHEGWPHQALSKVHHLVLISPGQVTFRGWFKGIFSENMPF